MKTLQYSNKFFLFFIALLGWSVSYGQVTVTSDDVLDCNHHTATLNATFAGDDPTPSGIHIDDHYPDAALPIGFTFNFYGTDYTQCLIGPNGTISFNISLVGSFVTWVATGPLLGQAPVFNSVCGPWCDIDISPGFPASGTITYSTTGSAPFRKFIVTFCKAHMFSCTEQMTSSQMILYETTNIVEVHIGHKDICSTWYGSTPGLATIGVQNATGTAATAAPGRDFAVFTCDHEAWRFTPDATLSSYACTSIAYAPVPYASSLLYWYDAGTGAFLGTGPTLTVTPTVTTTYKVGAVGCADTSFAYYTAVIASGLTITTGDPIGSTTPDATTAPSKCGLSDGTFTVIGLTPGLIDTIYYKKDGVLQPVVISAVSSTGTIKITGLPAGTYDKIVAKESFCKSDSIGPVIITDPVVPMNITPVNQSVCGATDGKLELSGMYPSHMFTINYTIGGVAQPPYTTTSDASGNISITGLPEGDYASIVASYSPTCATAPGGPFTLAGPAPPNVNIVSVISPSECGKCNGSIRIRPIKPFSSDTVSYTYNTVVMPPIISVAMPDSSVYLPGLCAGSYYNMSIKIGHCVTLVNGTAILTDPPLTAHFNDNVVLACHGDSVFFHNTSSSTGALYYLWSFGDGSSDSITNPVHVYPAGTYTVHLTATNHYCNSYDSTTFTLGHPLKAVFTETPDILCQGQTAVTTNTSIGATGYTWMFSNSASDTAANATYTYQRAGTYNLTLIAHNDIPCYDTAYKTVYVDTISGIGINLTDSVACSGTYITLTGNYASLGNTGITWQYGDNQKIENVNPVKHSYAAEGLYTVTATAHYRACPETTATRLVRIFQQPTINIGKDTSICKGSEVIKLADHLNNNAIASYVWNTGEKTKEITIASPGKYYATVNINNCYASDTIEVANDCYMNLPNAFTPNGDGINDYFFPRQFLTKGLTEFRMNIYNRWGQLIFETTTLDGSGWDGKLNGVDQPSGVYVYIIDGTFRDGQHEHHQGNVTLLR